MNKILLFQKKKWSKKNYKYLNKKKFTYYKNLNFKTIEKIKPKIIFFIHWSKKIERKIFKNFYAFNFIALIYQSLEVDLQFKIKYLKV